MKKKLIIAGLILVILVGSYGIAWFKSYDRTVTYYNNAMENYQNGDYASALKGTKRLKDDKSGYEYLGGFQQAMEIWESKYAFPKPDIAEAAENMAQTLISELDAKACNTIFQTYFRKDNKFLPEILIRMGDLQMEEGQLEKAKDTYEMAMGTFGHLPEVAEMISAKLEELEALQ